jgi:hypothetical protein
MVQFREGRRERLGRHDLGRQATHRELVGEGSQRGDLHSDRLNVASCATVPRHLNHENW